MNSGEANSIAFNSMIPARWRGRRSNGWADLDTEPEPRSSDEAVLENNAGDRESANAEARGTMTRRSAASMSGRSGDADARRAGLAECGIVDECLLGPKKMIRRPYHTTTVGQGDQMLAVSPRDDSNSSPWLHVP